ncbi:D-amino-acid transaminase [Maricaulis sp. MIT060901]|uniref:D-amino-acid transaminase n=1 Tax=Maricaulis sp. MIT060901 TaxID=3096993 RepID=UPI00399B1218
MSRYAYVNSAFVPHRAASVHIEDRGFQFGDAVYEVWSVRDGHLLDEQGHFERLYRSLDQLDIRFERSQSAMQVTIHELLRRNRIREGLVYLQISRGVAPRDHAFPATNTPPTIVLTAKRFSFSAAGRRAEQGVRVITHEDERWDRCDIKSVNLLANVLAKQAAREEGAYEAWLVDKAGLVTEGSSTTAWIVNADGELVTRPLDNHILHGITRKTVVAVANAMSIPLIERAFTPAEAKSAREAFITSASSFVMPVVQIDNKMIGNGAPGSLSLSLRDEYLRAQ